MKIAVQGNIIDTKDIYRISEVRDLTPIQYASTFTIFFYNEKNLEIIESFMKENDDIWKSAKRTYQKVSELRNKVINIWNDNKGLDIPTFDIE